MSHDNHNASHDHGGHGEYHGPTSFWTKYVFSIDHKVIGLQFMFTSLLFVIVGGLFALAVRYELAWPQQDVPHASVLPGKLTTEAPEANPALWKSGKEVKLMMDVEVDGKKYPAGAKATFVDLPKGIAVTVPYETRVKGKEFALGNNVNGYIEHGTSVMADYAYERQVVRAAAGTKVIEEGAPAGAEPLVLLAAPDYQTTGPDPILLDVRKDATIATLKIADQEVAGVKVAAAEIKIGSDKIKYPKQSLTPDAFNQLFTMHASVMIFFVIIPMLVGAFGNFLVPLMIGARDMAFPKLNMLSYWLAMPAGIVMIATLWIDKGAAGGGWTNYPPLASLRFSPNLGTTLWIGGVALVGFSSIVGALNYITTTINMRAPGMGLFRMPLTVWSILITSILALLATPVLTAAMIMLLLDRTMGTQFFADTILQTADGVTKQVPAGGQPIMWQHLFWFYSHPAVYIMILPAMGLASDILATFARKPIFGYKPMAFAMAGIAFLGFIVWGHHMFQSGMNPIAGTSFMATTIMIAIPSAIKTFNWLGTLWGGNIQYTPSMLFALGFVSMFVIGGLSGIFMAAAPVDIHIHDTYFIVAHIHYVLFGGSMMGIFAGVYHWFPKMFGRQLNQKWGWIHFFMTIIAFNGTFFLMHVLGVGGHPRRYATIMKYPQLLHLQPMNVFMTISAMMLGMAQLPFFYNFFVSLPRKLGRGVTAIFVIGLVAPMVTGLSIWAAKNGLGFDPADPSATPLPWFKSMIHHVATNGGGTWRYAGWAAALGYVGLAATLIAVFVMWVRGLPMGGKIATVLTLGPLLVFFVIPTLGSGGKLYAETGELNKGMESAKMWHDILVGVGHACVFGAAVVAIVWAIWQVGGKIGAPRFLQRAMYVWFLPAFLAPLILKHDTYMALANLPVIGWFVNGETYDLRWILLILSALPGTAYLVLYKPQDQFGHDVGPNPWHAASLEWCATTSPPLGHGNFETIPTVYRGPYEYSSPVTTEDWIPQTAPLLPGEAELQAKGH